MAAVKYQFLIWNHNIFFLLERTVYQNKFCLETASFNVLKMAKSNNFNSFELQYIG